MKVLVVGGGGREHAIVRALNRSAGVSQILCAPGNAGIARDARCAPVEATDLDGLVSLARDEGIDLVVVGPEAPLVAGLVDALEEREIAAFGPSGEAARLEGSKLFAKQVMADAGVPTADFAMASDREAAEAALDELGLPIVFKADGLAAGKGVIVCADRAEADEALEVFFGEQRFGDDPVLIEQALQGPELSLLAVCDGEQLVVLAPAQDFKRIGEDDRGPNTGGMGSFSPVPGLDEAQIAEIADAVHRPVLREMSARGTPFRGVLYAGLMMTPDGPRVLEFNCRFGDPETQAVLPRMRTDALELFQAALEPGGLDGFTVDFDPRSAVTVVLASAGYPASSSKGDVIGGLDEAARHAEVIHAGTALSGEQIVTAGGRVLALTGLGDGLAAARTAAYTAADAIDFQGKQIRRDIARRAAESTPEVPSAS